jgi:hypothetical protein
MRLQFLCLFKSCSMRFRHLCVSAPCSVGLLRFRLGIDGFDLGLRQFLADSVSIVAPVGQERQILLVIIRGNGAKLLMSYARPFVRTKPSGRCLHRSGPAVWPPQPRSRLRHTEGDRKACLTLAPRLIFAARQSARTTSVNQILQMAAISDNHRSTRSPLLIQIDARFASRLSRHTPRPSARFVRPTLPPKRSLDSINELAINF